MTAGSQSRFRPYNQPPAEAVHAAVANIFLYSAEYRTIVIAGYYAILLNTSNPAPADVAAWVNSHLDFLTIQVLFAASPGFQANG